MLTGKLLWFDEPRNCGLIKMDSDGSSILFCLEPRKRAANGSFEEGVALEFEIQFDAQQRRKAVNVKRAAGEDNSYEFYCAVTEDTF